MRLFRFGRLQFLPMILVLIYSSQVDGGVCRSIGEQLARLRGYLFPPRVLRLNPVELIRSVQILDQGCFGICSVMAAANEIQVMRGVALSQDYLIFQTLAYHARRAPGSMAREWAGPRPAIETIGRREFLEFVRDRGVARRGFWTLKRGVTWDTVRSAYQSLLGQTLPLVANPIFRYPYHNADPSTLDPNANPGSPQRRYPLLEMEVGKHEIRYFDVNGPSTYGGVNAFRYRTGESYQIRSLQINGNIEVALHLPGSPYLMVRTDQSIMIFELQLESTNFVLLRTYSRDSISSGTAEGLSNYGLYVRRGELLHRLDDSREQFDYLTVDVNHYPSKLFHGDVDFDGVEHQVLSRYFERRDPTQLVYDFPGSAEVIELTGGVDMAIVARIRRALSSAGSASSPRALYLSVGENAHYDHATGRIHPTIGRTERHAVTVVGYSENAMGAGPALIVQNSWGLSGLDGYYWVTLEDLFQMRSKISLPTE